MAPEPRVTMGELGRRLDRFEAVMGSRLDHLANALADSVATKVYEADQRTADAQRQAIEQRIEDMENRDRERAEEVATNRRLAVSALLAPLLVAVVSVLLYAAIIGRN